MPLYIATYTFLLIAILSLWIHRKPALFMGLLTVGVLCGFLAGRLHTEALLLIILLPILVYMTFRVRSRYLAICCGCLVFIVSLLACAHKMPGFTNWCVVKNARLSQHAMPYTLFLNFDKPLISLFLIGFGTHSLLRSWSAWKHMLKKAWPISLPGIALFSLMGYASGHIGFEPQIKNFAILFCINNLFFTSLAEEVLFRGFVQNILTQVFCRHPYGYIGGIICASLIFGFIHIGHPTYMILATFAGLFYGTVYHITKSIEASTLTHFLLNATHFMFFTYPALQKI